MAEVWRIAQDGGGRREFGCRVGAFQETSIRRSPNSMRRMISGGRSLVVCHSPWRRPLSSCWPFLRTLVRFVSSKFSRFRILLFVPSMETFTWPPKLGEPWPAMPHSNLVFFHSSFLSDLSLFCPSRRRRFPGRSQTISDLSAQATPQKRPPISGGSREQTMRSK